MYRRSEQLEEIIKQRGLSKEEESLMIDPSNKVYKWRNEEAKLTTYIVPVYIGIVIKGVSNIIV